MRNPFRRKALTATSEAIQAIRSNGSLFPLLGGGSRERILDAYNTAKSANYAWLYSNSPALRTVVDVIVRNVGQLDLRLYEEIDEATREPRPEHPAALSLRYPSELTPGDQFIRKLFKDFLLFDDATALMVPAANNRLALEWIPFHMIELKGTSLFKVEQYRFWRADGSFRDFDPEQILHWHGENPHDPRTGHSRLDTLRAVLSEDAALQQATIELANSGLQAPTWVFRPGDAPEWDNDDRKGFEEDLTNRLKRRNRTPVVLEEGMELRSFGVSPHDAQMFEVRRWAVERVAAAYGVPLGMVGLADNLKEAQSQFYADTLPPYCEEFTRMLNHRILMRAYGSTRLCFEFNLDEKHMGDDRIKSLVSATGRAVMLTDEARAKLNLPPVEGGDQLVTPLNVVVGKNPQPSVDVVNPADPQGQPRGVGDDQEPKALEPPRVKAEQLPQLHPGRKAELDRQHRNIDQAQAVVQRHFNRLERSLRNKSGKADWSRWDRELADDIHRLVENIVDKEGAIYAFKLGGDFDMALVANYLRAMAEGAAEGINTTIRSEINDLGLDEALGMRARHVESAGASLGAAATIWARMEAARQSPDTDRRVKTWVPNTERHAEFGGQTVPLGASWPAGFAPGTTPGCRCTLTIS